MRPRQVIPPCLAAIVLAALAIILASPGAQGQADEPPSATPAPPVGVSPVVERSINSGESFIGTITPTRRATVGSAVAGRVIDFPIEIGDRVEANQPLAQILTDTITLQIEAARAELDLRQQELNELENGARPEELAQSLAQLKSAQAASEYSGARLKRTQTLYERGGVTEQTLDEVQNLATAAEQALEEAQASYELVKAGPRNEQIAQARAQVDMQQAVIRQLEDELKKHTVTTRFAGYVVAESTEAGAWVSEGDPIAEIVALDQVDVQVHVNGPAVAFVEVGAEVRIQVPALPNELFAGTVVAINPQGNATTRTFPILVRILNQIDGQVPILKSGMIAKVVLPTGPDKETTLIPKDALVMGLAKPTIFVVEQSGQNDSAIARAVNVRLGVADGMMIEALGDLDAGQPVVVLGNETLQDGDRIRVTQTVTYEEGVRSPQEQQVGSLAPRTQ